jgi:hypothetical protein
MSTQEEQQARLESSDPTWLTTKQLLRELSLLKDIIFTRLDGMDRAIVLNNDNVNRVPNDVDRAVTHLKSLIEGRINAIDKATELLPNQVSEKINALEAVHNERFTSIQLQFKERDVRTEQSTRDSKTAVDAALQAAKEAVNEQNKSSSLAISKSENTTVKQIDQMGLLIATQAKAFEDKVTDLKERLTRIEGKGEGKTAQLAVADTSNRMNVSVISTLIAMAGLVITIVVLMMRH